MSDNKVLRIELARERTHENGYYYSTLDLPAEEYEIQDALQRARISGAHRNHHELSIRYCEDIPELQGLRLDAPSIDELNFLSRRIAGMDFMERRLYASVPQITEREFADMSDFSTLNRLAVMSGSVSRSKNEPSQSLQMMERPLLTADELKSLPKGEFVVMKTGVHPMRVKLKLSQSTVRLALHDLRREGLLETEQRYRPKGGKSSLFYKLKSE